MGKRVPHVHEDQSGRLIYRRAYPAELREHLRPKPRRELKVPLGAKGVLSASAMQRWERANRDFANDVREAQAALSVAKKARTASFDPLTPELSRYLVGAWKEESLELDAKVRWASRPLADKVRARAALVEDIQADLAAATMLRALGDIDTIVRDWSPTALVFAEGEGFRLDPKQPEFAGYVRDLHDAVIDVWHVLLRRGEGHNEPTPARPHLQRRQAAADTVAEAGASFQTIAETILTSSRKVVGVSTQEATRTALRLFTEVHGQQPPEAISRAMVADWLDLLAERPSKLPASERSMALPALVNRYRGRADVPRLSPKTIAQHVSMLAARWTQARRSGRLGAELANPFEDHDLEKPRKGEPKGFSPEELTAILALPIWSRGGRPRGGKGEASYWMFPFLLLTGARPEEAAQLLTSDFFQGADGRWMLKITDEGTHPHKGARTLKTGRQDIGRRVFPVPAQLLALGLIDYLEALATAGEVALFPRLRTKGARNLLAATFGQWWSKYLRDNGVRLEGVGRQPLRETRHTWSTAARRSGIPREAMAYIQGHNLADATSGEGYGDLSPLGLAIDRLSVAGFDLAAIRPWSPGRDEPE